ncbi:MBOAT family O-acyltransferase [Desulfolutivibrio sulfoxidireducens]|uniref:MBOAT family O-acyltransferase n=1 Tax=Desulfolutivibrio sulfoxidireducens TaxID=2773299 RepID=UPI00159D5E28|nr:MBOAT family protein [Desulfolutivibrio sulfoxidireducens]QLA15037.1 MBOAT family protein [Desulfolutivibrio sulfoxidireducens]QLA18606.1 MBOAT family protein [Desulfolutivibrio sulfoxidireducens]
MVFSSAAFLFYFLPLVLAGYFLLVSHSRARNWLLLAASLFFYAWGEGEFVAIMLVSIVANYFFGIWVYREHQRSESKLAISCAIAFNIILLIIFKYTNFIVDNINGFTAEFGIDPVIIGKVHLPIGISFFTFHCISYIMDIYRRQTPPQMSLPNTALYISLFPQLVAGPIVRYKDIAGQLISRHVDMGRFSRGVQRFVAGLGKKVLVANVVALPADKIFSIPPEQLTAPVAWLGILCYTLQIYFDFSGYSDMAIGLANMFGFKFMENFNYPYISRSLREFWRRWHISLSTWFRDYLYIPLGGNRCGPGRVRLNLVIVFFLTGLWHGASWNFIFWGLFHGAFLVAERGRFGKLLDEGPRIFGHAYAIVVFMVGWVFFRAADLTTAVGYLQAMFGFGTGSGMEWYVGLFVTPKLILVLCLGVVGVTPVIPWIKARRERLLANRRTAALDDGLEAVASLVLTPAIFVLCAMSLASGTHNPFIYFQF